MLALQEHQIIGFTDCIQALDALCSLSEDEFINVGSRLKEFYNKAATITERSSYVASLLSGHEIGESIEELNLIMQKISLYINQSESLTKKSIDTLQTAAKNIEDINMPLKRFHKITRTLRTLGTSAIIQNAQLTKSEQGFRLLGEDVKRLSAVISEKTKGISDGIESLNKIISKSIETLNLLSESQVKKTDVILKKSMSSICNLNEKYGSAAGYAQAISESSVIVSGSIENLVTLIQSHDIVRQKLETSQKAFNIISRNFDKDFKTDLNVRINTEMFPQKTVNELLSFCDSQSSFLKQVQEDFAAAVISIIENLGIVNSYVTEVLKKGKQIVSSEGFAGEYSLSEIKEDIASVTSILSTFSENISMRKELSETVAVVANTIEKLFEYIAEIEAIRDDIKLIALNAAITAAKVGEEGKALSVIADSIQIISSETKKYTEDLSGTLKSLTSYAKDLSGNMSSKDMVLDDEIKSVSEDLMRSVDFFTSTNEKIGDILNEVDVSTQSLSSSIEDVSGNLHLHKIVDGTINEILSSLSSIKTIVKQSLPESEADTYETQGEPAIVSGAVEYIKMTKRHSEFGDNVELFDS